MTRAFDLIVSMLALILLAPVMILVAILVALDVGMPILFEQTRIGKDAKAFVLYKFRTMRDVTGSEEEPLPDAERLTKLGIWLRKASLDELPSLFNVVRGEMSLVGPRPLLPRYLDRYTPRQARRHEVKPGITGWAQVNGRNAITWEEKFELDVWYVENCGFILDLKILAMTVGAVFRRSEVAADSHATMPEFLGTADPNRVDDANDDQNRG